MGVLDRFDRATLGANWSTPTFNPASWSALEIAPEQGAVQLSAGAGGSQYCSGIYIGQTFNPRLQYAEITVLVEQDFSSYSAFYNPYNYYAVSLNVLESSSGIYHAAGVAIGGQVYYTSLDDLTWAISIKLDNGSFSPTRYAQDYISHEELFPLGPRIPVGTKLRAERIGDTYYFCVYSPDLAAWKFVGSYTDTGPLIDDGYPGFEIYADDDDGAKVTDFRAGDDIAEFIAPTLTRIDMSDGNVQTLTADGSTTEAEYIGAVYVSVSEGTWGSGTLKIERKNANGEWKDISDASFTADFDKVLDFPPGSKNALRATLSGSTSPDLDVDMLGSNAR